MLESRESESVETIAEVNLIERSLGQKVLFSLLATFFFGLGIIGVILPGLPSTPFLLLMSYFLIRVSPRLHDWVTRWPVVGVIIDDWHNRRGVKPVVKYYAILVVVTLVGTTFYFGKPHWSVGMVMVAAVAIGIVTILRIPSIKPED